MYEYCYGEQLAAKRSDCCIETLKETFAKDYDIKSNRLWNCLTVPSKSVPYEAIKKFQIREPVYFYHERLQKIYITKYSDICRYVDQLEPWEFIDAYIFDTSFSWLIAITHEDLMCILAGDARF